MVACLATRNRGDTPTLGKVTPFGIHYDWRTMNEQGESRPRRALPPNLHDPEIVPPAADPAQSVAEGGTPPRRGGRRFLGDEPASGATPKRGQGASDVGRRRLIVGGITALALSVLFGGAWLAQRTGWLVIGPAPAPASSVDPVATYLAQPEDLNDLAPGSTWTIADTVTKLEPTTPQAKCFLPAAEQKPVPAHVMVRTFASATQASGAVLYQVNQYANAEEATTAYTGLISQLGVCERTTMLAQTGLKISGLSDGATGQILVVQNPTNEYHTIALSRTADRVNIVDVALTDAPSKGDAVAGVLRAVAVRQCVTSGKCPGQVSVTPEPPLPSKPSGWLAEVDLPRITVGSGSWRATDVTDSVALPGTKCEAIDLAAPPGATAKQQRTYLLRDDTAAPKNFGVDEAMYTFGTPEEAQATFLKLAQNTDNCAGRTATAQVARTGDPSGNGTSAAWTVVQKVDQASTTAKFRSAAAVAGNRVIYLVANPSDSFDFSNDTWHGVVGRAQQRLSQIG